MRYSVTRTFRTCTAHYLDQYAGKCQHMHGHNYVFHATVEVDASPAVLDETGMLVDFGDLKRFYTECIEPWDHALLTPLTASQVEELMAYSTFNVQEALKAFGIRSQVRVIGCGTNPTAEFMSWHLARSLMEMLVTHQIELPPQMPKGAEVTVRIRVEETENCSAEACVTGTITLGPDND